MPMEGSSEEYEKLALAALKKAASADSDPTYHNNRAAIFAYLAQAAASSEMAESMKAIAGNGGSMGPVANGAAPRSAPPRPPESPAAAPAPAASSQDATPGMDLVPRASD